MERLTRPNLNVDQDTDRFLHAVIGGKEIDWKQCRDSTLNVLINGPTSNGFCKDIFRKMARDLYGRLKAYEDMGLEPEAVETVKLALAEKHMVDLETLNNTTISRLVELAEADKDGRVIVLPCKVGDTVYMIERIFDIDNGVCDEICARKVIGHGGNNLNKLWLIGSGGICNVSIFVSEFGKTVFLTRAEAEKALREIQGKEDADGTTD